MSSFRRKSSEGGNDIPRLSEDHPHQDTPPPETAATGNFPSPPTRPVRHMYNNSVNDQDKHSYIEIIEDNNTSLSGIVSSGQTEGRDYEEFNTPSTLSDRGSRHSGHSSDFYPRADDDCTNSTLVDDFGYAIPK